jgi:hypothetical protein
LAYGIRDHRILEVLTDAGSTVIAASADPNWSWRAAVAVPSGHPLAAETTAIYVLEFDSIWSRFRILRFVL